MRRKLPTRRNEVAHFLHGLQQDRVVLEMPKPSDQHPTMGLQQVLANLIQNSDRAMTARFVAHESAAKAPQPTPRHFARSGLLLALANASFSVERDPSTTISEDIVLWRRGYRDAPIQQSLPGTEFRSEFQWRPARASDNEGRAEYQIGHLDRPDTRLYAFENADVLAARMAGELVSLIKGASRMAETAEAATFSRLVARAIATLVENVAEHAFDYGCLPADILDKLAHRSPKTSLLVSFTRGGGTKATQSRQSDNRIYIAAHDNGLSIPTTVRNNERLGGITDSHEILKSLLLNSLPVAGRSGLRGLGYPELVELSEVAVSKGWSVKLDVMTQAGDLPGDALLASRELRPGVTGDEGPSVHTLAGASVLGTSVLMTVRIPGFADWLTAEGAS